MSLAIKTESLSKAYQIGQFTTGTLSRDIERWFALVRGKEDPFLQVGEVNDRSVKGNSNIVWSLKDLDFEIEQGDTVGIIGKNGAGKSTLLKILSRVTSPTSGSVKIRGRVASLLEVGTGFHPELTGRENIYLNGAILGMHKSEITRKFDEIVDFSGVERYIDTPVKRYSSGMYVRLAFAVAAHLESEILVVDEVLAVGDAEFQKKCLGRMGEVSKTDGRTILFVSHNMSAVRTLCRKGITLSNGMLSYSGEIDTAVEKYLSSTIASSVTQKRYPDGARPGDEIVELIEYSLVDSGDKNIERFNLYEDVLIKVQFKVKKGGFQSSPNLHFFNQEGQYLFVFGANDDHSVNSEGVYICSFTIPAYTFNEGIFSVGIAVTSYPGTVISFFINPAITFEVEESNTYLRKSSYLGSIPGFFRPVLKTEIEKVKS
jgi:lipopolysaccharide transport system ATP-binding protein